MGNERKKINLTDIDENSIVASFKDHQAEDMIFADWMLCPLYYYTDIYMLSPVVDNTWASPLGFKYFMYATPKAA